MRRARVSLALLAMIAASAPAARNLQPPVLWSASGGEVTASGTPVRRRPARR
jgi:hypothetical protein